MHSIITDVLVQVGEPSVLAEVNAAFAAHVQLMLRPQEERDPTATILSPDQRHSAYVAAITGPLPRGPAAHPCAHAHRKETRNNRYGRSGW